MQPFRIVSNTINNNQYYRRFAQNPLIMNWGWLFSFLMISIFNGWMINVSEVDTSFLPSNWALDGEHPNCAKNPCP